MEQQIQTAPFSMQHFQFPDGKNAAYSLESKTKIFHFRTRHKVPPFHWEIEQDLSIFEDIPVRQRFRCRRFSKCESIDIDTNVWAIFRGMPTCDGVSKCIGMEERQWQRIIKKPE